MSNPPVPIPLRVLRGNPSKRRLPREVVPERTTEPPDCPDFLRGYAADEWHRVVPALHPLGLLSVLDIQVLAAYCTAYATWRTASEALAHMAERDGATHGLLIKRASDGNPMRNPLVTLAAAAANDMVKYAAEFGFSPAARARVAAGVAHEPPSKFAGLLVE